jgi:chromosome segregation ATPase
MDNKKLSEELLAARAWSDRLQASLEFAQEQERAALESLEAERRRVSELLTANNEHSVGDTSLNVEALAIELSNSREALVALQAENEELVAKSETLRENHESNSPPIANNIAIPLDRDTTLTSATDLDSTYNPAPATSNPPADEKRFIGGDVPGSDDHASLESASHAVLEANLAATQDEVDALLMEKELAEHRAKTLEAQLEVVEASLAATGSDTARAQLLDHELEVANARVVDLEIRLEDCQRQSDTALGSLEAKLATSELESQEANYEKIFVEKKLSELAQLEEDFKLANEQVEYLHVVSSGFEEQVAVAELSKAQDDATIALLHARLEASEEDLEATSLEKTLAEHRVSALESQLEALRSDIQGPKSALDVNTGSNENETPLAARVKDLEGALALEAEKRSQKAAEIELLRAQRRAAQEETSALVLEKDLAEIRVSKLESSLSEAQSAATASEASLHELERLFENAKEAQESLREEASALSHQVSEMKSEKAQTHAILKVLELNLAGATEEAEAAELERQLAESRAMQLVEDLKAAEIATGQATACDISASKDLESLKKALELREAESASLSEDLTQRRTQNEELELLLKHARDCVATLEGEVGTQTRAKDIAEARAAELETALEAVKTSSTQTNYDAHAMVDTLKVEAKHAKKAQASLRAEVKALSNQIELLEADKAKHSATLQVAEAAASEKRVAQERLAQLELELRSVNTEASVDSKDMAQNNSLRSELTKAKKAGAALRAELKIAKASAAQTIANLEAELSQSQELRSEATNAGSNEATELALELKAAKKSLASLRADVKAAADARSELERQLATNQEALASKSDVASELFIALADARVQAADAVEQEMATRVTLEAQVDECNSEIEALTMEKDLDESTSARLENELEALRAECVDRERSDAQAAVDAQSDLETQLVSARNEFQEALDAKDDKATGLQEALDDARSQLEEVKMHCSTSRTTLEAQLDACNSEIEALTMEKDLAESTFARQESELGSLRAEHADKSRLDLEVAEGAQSNHMDQVTTARDELQTKFEATTKEAKDLTRDLRSAKKSLASLRADAKAAADARSDLETQLATNQEALASRLDEVRELRRELEEACARAADAEDYTKSIRTTLEAKLDACNSEIEALTMEKDLAESTTVRLENELKALRAEYADRERLDMQASEDAQSDLEAQLAVVRDELRELLKSKKLEIDKLQEALTDARIMARDSEEQELAIQAKLEAKLDACNSEIEALTMEKDLAESTTVRLENELKALRADYADRER